MIGVGELPVAPRPSSVRRRTLSYTMQRRRRARLLPTVHRASGGPRSARAPRPPAVNTGDMIFDQPPAELPVATLHTRDGGTQLLLDVRAWLASKWRWLRPRTIPVAAAGAGLIALLVSASYLRELAHRMPEPARPAPVIATSHAQDPLAPIQIHSQPPGAGTLVIDPPTEVIVVSDGGEPVVLSIEPGIYQIRIEPADAAPPAP